MKTYLYFLSFLGFSFIANAQQNLFNIPSGDITPHKKLFYQHQFNVYDYKLESKSHLVYGLGKGWDAGVNLVGSGVGFKPTWELLQNEQVKNGNLFPVLMGTLQKQFVISEKLEINIGTQMGINISGKLSNQRLNHFTYLLNNWHITHKFRIVSGLFKSNKFYTGNANTFGVLGGFEWHLSKKLYAVGDWVSGRNDASVAVLGGVYNLSKRIQICAGWQLPNPKTPKTMALVIELNLQGWDIE
ncbi:MAG: hypothetical protein U0V72_13625 [Cytophagales bacterium]